VFFLEASFLFCFCQESVLRLINEQIWCMWSWRQKRLWFHEI